MKHAVILMSFLTFFLCQKGFGYRIEGGEFFASGGFGANVNVARYDVPHKATPRAELSIITAVDYAIDSNWGVFGGLVPQFAAGSVSFLFRGGAKYWFNYWDAPYVPYVSFALTPSFLFPMKEEPNHVNLGFSPGVGMNFFVTAKMLVGAHIHFNPSVAFIDGNKKFEFSVMTFFDVMMRL